MIESPSREMRNRSLVAHHLWHIKDGSLESSRATCHESSGGVGEKSVGVIACSLDAFSGNEGFVVTIVDARSTGKNGLIVRKFLYSFHHCRQVVLNLLFATSCKQSDDRFFCVQMIAKAEFLVGLLVFRAEKSYLVSGRITYIMNRIAMLLLEEIHFEWQYGEEFLHVALDIFDAPFFPSPQFWSNEIESRATLPLCCRMLAVVGEEFRDGEIESSIVNEDYHIRLPSDDVLLAHFHITHDGRKMQEHRDKAHVGKFLVMTHSFATDGRHTVATEEAELRLWVLRFKGFHEM